MHMRFAVLLTMMAAGGCAPTLPPVVRVTDARVLESTDAGVRLAVDLVLENPNDFPLPLERVAYRVAVPDAALVVYAGDALPARTVPANGVQTVRLTAGLAGLAEGAGRGDAGLVGELAQGLATGLAGALGAIQDGAPDRSPDEAWTAGAAAGQAWRVSGDITYAADRGLRTFLTETGVPLPTAAFHGEGVLAAPALR